MTAPVSFLRSADPLRQADSAYLAADYSRALELIEQASPVTLEVLTLRAMILRRLDRFEEALEAVRAALAMVSNPCEEAQVLVTLARVHIGRGAPVDVRSTIARINRSKSGYPIEIRSEVAYLRAWTSYCSGDLRAAEEDIIEAYVDPHPFSRARAILLQSFIFGARGDYQDQAEILARSLRELRDVPVETYDIGIRAQILYALAGLARDIEVPFTAVELRDELRAIPWTPYLNEARYWASRSIGFRMSQEGGVGARLGIGLLRESTEYASTPARRVLSLLDAADVSFSVNEQHNGGALLDESEKLSATIDWTKEIRDERVALLHAATLFARQKRTDKAQKYLDIFRSLPPMSHMMAFAHDRRLEAMQAHAEGVVARYNRDKDQAVDRLSDAFEIFVKINYNWQSVLCAQELYEITQADVWRDHAIKRIKAYSNSWLAVKIKGAGLVQDARYQLLTPKERQVFDLLIGDYDRSAIALKLGVKAPTINTHVDRIFRKWNVKSQRQLLAAVRRVR